MRILFAFALSILVTFTFAQTAPTPKQRTAIVRLIDNYSKAREKRDTVLLKTILTSDIDQLVSTGEWREGVAPAVKGMQRSAAENPGSRTLTIDKVRMISSGSAIVDCKYEIKNEDGRLRKMWSTFIVVNDKNDLWKIAAIRNMLPSQQ